MRRQLLTVLTALVMGLVFASDSLAMYNPKLGRFMQRDTNGQRLGPSLRVGTSGFTADGSSGFLTRDRIEPGVQYTDGMSLHAAHFVMADSVDPSGEVVVRTAVSGVLNNQTDTIKGPCPSVGSIFKNPQKPSKDVPISISRTWDPNKRRPTSIWIAKGACHITKRHGYASHTYKVGHVTSATPVRCGLGIIDFCRGRKSCCKIKMNYLYWENHIPNPKTSTYYNYAIRRSAC